MMFQKVLKETTEVLIRIEPKEVTIRQAKNKFIQKNSVLLSAERVIYHELAVVEIQAIADF